MSKAGDSDGDGMSDDFENANGLDPNDPTDALLDPDDDGLTNLEESKLGTNPFNTDSDGDGVDDQTELFSGSDPVDPNSTNHPPVIVSAPEKNGSIDQQYAYGKCERSLTAPLNYALLVAPTGMTISSAGAIQWTPGADQSGPNRVIVEVSDGRGGNALQQYQVTVLQQGIDIAVTLVDILP
ncbi:MAG: putative Ig domain-containing protein [Candidatus Competibacteraceae bacterium]